jgi:hypothetical protein
VVRVNRVPPEYFPLANVTGRLVVHALGGNDRIIVSPKIICAPFRAGRMRAVMPTDTLDVLLIPDSAAAALAGVSRAHGHRLRAAGKVARRGPRCRRPAAG